MPLMKHTDPDSQMAGCMQSIVQKNMDACYNQLDLCFSGRINIDCVFSADRAGQMHSGVDVDLCGHK